MRARSILDGKQIKTPFVSGKDHAPGLLEAQGDSQLAGEDVHRAHGQNPEAHSILGIRGFAQSIDDLMHGSIPACGNNHLKTFPGRFGGRLLAAMSALGRFERRLRMLFLEEPRPLVGATASGRRIEDNANRHEQTSADAFVFDAPSPFNPLGIDNRLQYASGSGKNLRKIQSTNYFP